jgi:hypothetical protein
MSTASFRRETKRAMGACPRCQTPLADDARVCRACLLVLDRTAWRHDAGRLGADARGGGRPLEDPPVGPLPVTGGTLAGGVLAGALRLVQSASLLRRRRAR